MQRFLQSVAQPFLGLFRVPRRLALVAAVLLTLCVLTFLTSHSSPTMQKTPIGSSSTTNENMPVFEEPDKLNDLSKIDNAERSRIAGGAQLQAYAHSDGNDARSIAYCADLGVITKDFVHARSSMEEILDRHRGYASRLRMVGHPSGSSLSATLKVPATEYSSALADLKSIGDVQQDAEAADEVIQQRGDILARLQNVQNNERRLQELLKNSDDKSIDVDYVRRQLAALHAEIVRLELQRNSYDDKVVFSSIHFSLREVRETPAETVSAQIRRAAASGLTDLVATLSAFLVFLVGYGPSFLLWGAIIFLPARYFWRRTRTPLARETA